MDDGYGFIRFLVVAVLGLVCLFSMPAVFLSLVDQLDSPESAKAPAEPAEPIDWNPLIIVGAVIIAAAFLVVLVVLGVKFVGRRKKAALEAATAAETNIQAWKDVLARHDAVKDHYYEYAIEDLDLVLRFPALQDASEKFVAAFLQKFYVANDCRPSAIDGTKDPAGTQYMTAVGELERAWDHALTEARRIAGSHLSQEARKRLKTARKHWAVVNDEAATAAERALHARQLQKCLDGLIDLEDKPRTATALDSAIRLSLESSAASNPASAEPRGFPDARGFFGGRRAVRTGK